MKRLIDWNTVKEFEDITYKKCNGVARIAFNRPNVRNAFRPKTTSELYQAFYDAMEDTSIGVVLLSAEGPSTKDGVYSFCSGGDQRARGHQGYVGEDGYHRLNILEVQRLIRFMPKAVIAVVPGWAVGGGHSLHLPCTIIYGIHFFSKLGLRFSRKALRPSMASSVIYAKRVASPANTC